METTANVNKQSNKKKDKIGDHNTQIILNSKG